jgi:DNA polymerase-3 subunit gamma/tau
MLVKLSHIEAALTLANQAPSYINEVKKKPENLGHNQNPSTEVKVASKEIAVNETPLITTSGNLPFGKTKDVKVDAEIKPKSLIKSIPSSHSLIPDLKNLTTPSNLLKEPDIEILEGIEQSEFSESELNEVWVAYILILKEKNRMALAALMDHYKPHLIENFVIELTLSNKLQEEELKNGKIELLNYLRTSLKNFAIQIQTFISAKEIKGRPYTAQEKYLYFVEKNPQIEVLKNTFNLNVL